MKPTFLIIDSGATNSTWKFMQDQSTTEVLKFKGFNLSTSRIRDFTFAIPATFMDSITGIFFFGAGTGNFDKEEQLKVKLLDLFPNAQRIMIESDLLTAGIALSQGEKSVVSILGTGSNTCIFDGRTIIEKVNNLGFILGDEGSGFQMGKKVLQDYFYNEMSVEDLNLFSKKYALTRDSLIKNVYHRNEKPNSYIASFSAFLAEATETYRREVAIASLSSFFEKQVLKLEDRKGLEYHFSGSISWHFKEEIKELCLKNDCKLGKIIQNPIDSLAYSKLLELI